MMHVLRRAPWLTLFLLAGCVSSPVAMRQPALDVSPPSQPVIPAIQRIIVDAGHGGNDPGTGHFGLQEKHLTLDISRRLQAALQAKGFSVVLTRDKDVFVPLSRRPEAATRAQGDLFVSVHVNANRSPQVAGVEVYYPRESVLGKTASLPPRIGPAEVATPTWTIQQILWDLVLSRSRRQSVRLATQICRAMRTGLGVKCRGVRGARFVVLREARMPAVLVEVGYLSNRAEASRLATVSYRQAIADSIAEGLVTYTRELGLQHI